MPSSVLYEAAKETLVEYFQKTSLNGFGLLYYIRRRKYQRLLWFLFIVMGVTFAIYVCLTSMMSFLSEPTVTVLDTHPHTIYRVPFPSIAVCSNNKFSHYAIQQYARNITRRNFDLNPPEYWERKLELFVGFLNTQSLDFDEALEFQNEIEKIFGKPINTRETLMTLAPRCEDIIVKCYWAGKAQNCEEQFELMAFLDGTCCVFNYQYERSLESLHYTTSTGPEMGLALVLNGSTNDYFYAEDNSNGFNIQIFGTQRIPDVSTGEIKEFHVSAGEDIDVMLNLVTQRTTAEARAYSVQKRGCYFPEEHEDAAYGQSQCLWKCKVHSIETLCDCTPFYAVEGGVKQCTLAQSECLERYRITWQTYFVNTALHSDLDDELVNSIMCTYCLPLCSYNLYYYRKATARLSEILIRKENEKYLSSVSELSTDLSLVKIYFPSQMVTRYKKNVLYNWYQILAYVGGVLGISMGCSIISGFEIIYFGSFRLIEKYLILKRNRN